MAGRSDNETEDAAADPGALPREQPAPAASPTDAAAPAEKPPRPLWQRLLLRVVRIFLLLCIGLAVFIVLFENKMIYFPTRHPQGDWKRAEQGAPALEDVWMTAEDGVKIHGWLARGEGAKVTVLYFHGNAGNLSDRVDWIRALTRIPANVLAVDYRGYGRSEGAPDEKGIYKDARAAYGHLVDGLKIAPKRIIVYGKSLGGGAACEIASTKACGGLIVQSTFTSIPDMAGRVIPVLGPLLVRTHFGNEQKIGRVDAAVLVVHSRADELIPFAMGERLYAAAAEPKRSAWFDVSGHNDLIRQHEGKLIETFRAFVREEVLKEEAPK